MSFVDFLFRYDIFYTYLITLIDGSLFEQNFDLTSWKQFNDIFQQKQIT